MALIRSQIPPVALFPGLIEELEAAEPSAYALKQLGLVSYRYSSSSLQLVPRALARRLITLCAKHLSEELWIKGLGLPHILDLEELADVLLTCEDHFDISISPALEFLVSMRSEYAVTILKKIVDGENTNAKNIIIDRPLLYELAKYNVEAAFAIARQLVFDVEDSLFGSTTGLLGLGEDFINDDEVGKLVYARIQKIIDNPAENKERCLFT